MEFGHLAADVTIAIACYNQGRFLGQAIRSAQEQTTPAVEIIVVDDGSYDDTGAVARSFPDVRHIHQPNAGLSAARNTGLALARAEYILFLDADDWLAPDALDRALAAVRTSPRPPALVHGGYAEVAEDGALLTTHRPRSDTDAFRGLLQGNHIAMHGTVLYDTAILRASGGFDTTLRSCEDYDVYLRLARDHPIASYPGIAAFYRRHGASLSRNQMEMIATALRVIDRHLRASGGAPADVAAARAGRQAMIDYYLHQIASDSRHKGNNLRTTGTVLRELLRRPKLALQLARWAAARWTRAVTRTG